MDYGGVSINKREIIKSLKKEFSVLKRSDASHDLIVVIDDIKYYIKIMNTNSNIQFTLNSRYVWQLKKGRISGIRFKGSSSALLDVRNFMSKENRVVILTNKPYKILMYLNESEIVDVSTKSVIHGTKFIYDFRNINC